ncbi:hypothetical protein ACFPRL_30745 [Pseudoclavibacter helvolus]
MWTGVRFPPSPRNPRHEHEPRPPSISLFGRGFVVELRGQPPEGVVNLVSSPATRPTSPSCGCRPSAYRRCRSPP